jgi:hypothetical protein
MKVCDTCRFWSEMCAQALDGGPIEALCLCDDGPKHGEFTRGITTCDRWASNHLGQWDDPPDHGEAVRAAYAAEEKGGANPVRTSTN